MTDFDITGRDGYIIAKALHWFVKTQAAMPPELQQESDSADASVLLRARYPGYAKLFQAEDALRT